MEKDDESAGVRRTKDGYPILSKDACMGRDIKEFGPEEPLSLPLSRAAQPMAGKCFPGGKPGS